MWASGTKTNNTELDFGSPQKEKAIAATGSVGKQKEWEHSYSKVCYSLIQIEIIKDGSKTINNMDSDASISTTETATKEYTKTTFLMEKESTNGEMEASSKVSS